VCCFQAKAFNTMKGISLVKAGGPENLKYDDVPHPKLGDGQVMIEVYATALNGADLLQRAGNYPQPPGAATHQAMLAYIHADMYHMLAFLHAYMRTDTDEELADVPDSA